MSSREHKTNLLHAFEEAQKIAFAPFIFQAVASAKKTGLLDTLGQSEKSLTVYELSVQTGLSTYAVQILVDILVASNVIELREDSSYRLGLVGKCLIYDLMTEVNFDFTNLVNYKALSHTTESLQTGRPCGLKEFNASWSTIYPHLKDLPTEASKAWFSFDHFHSDSAYQAALDVIREKNIRYFLDIGGNTGRFTFKALKTWPKSRACIVDLPEQITLMKHNSTLSSVADRIDTYPINWLDKSSKPLINKNIDLIWMSQFLDCFSREQAISILKRVHSLASEKQATIAILEPLVDKQRNSAATLSIASTSLYFSCLANGNSKFFTSKELQEIIGEAGLQIISIHEPLGVGHSLYLCD